MTDLEKMDALKERMDVTYTQAKEALDASGGDLAAALVYLEKQAEAAKTAAQEAKGAKWDKDTTENFVRGLIEQIKAVIQEGNVTKVRLKQGDHAIIEVPATLGVVGLGVILFSPLLLAIGAIGAAAAVMKEMSLEIERPDGTIESRSLKFPSSAGREAKPEEGEPETKEKEDEPAGE